MVEELIYDITGGGAMKLFSRECTLFKSNGILPSPRPVIVNTFEEYAVLEKKQTHEIGEYSWVDTVRYRDKIISRSKKHVLIVYFEKSSTFALFSNSESDVAFVIRKFNEIFTLYLTKKNVFNELVSSLLVTKSYITKIHNIGSIQFRTVLENDIQKEFTIVINDSNWGKLNLALNSADILNLNLVANSWFYFDLDCSSVFSFHDNSNLEEIIDVLKSYI